jgi:hypothetical protein
VTAARTAHPLVFYRDGAAVPADQILEELRAGAPVGA